MKKALSLTNEVVQIALAVFLASVGLKAFLLPNDILDGGVTAMLLSLEVAMYSTLTFVVTGKVIDFVFQRFEDYVGLWIVSEKSLKNTKEFSGQRV